MRDAGTTSNPNIVDGVTIVMVMPLNKNSIWRELYRVYTLHDSVGFVEVGLETLLSLMEMMEAALTSAVKHEDGNS